jgi:hypothetical protein
MLWLRNSIIPAVTTLVIGLALLVGFSVRLNREAGVLRERGTLLLAAAAATESNDDNAVIRSAQAYFREQPRHPSREAEERMLAYYEAALLRWVRLDPQATIEGSKQATAYFVALSNSIRNGGHK